MTKPYPHKLQDPEVIAQAINGEPHARTLINEEVHGIICHKTVKFCKTYCQSNRYQYTCTLPINAWSAPTENAPLCEWGNGSYAWMLNDLTKPERLQKFEARQGASLKEYLNTIANSLAFRERWKDWRFSRKVYVPLCVQRIHDAASRVFFGLYNQKSCEEIAQQLAMPVEETRELADRIIIVLTQEKKLHVLNAPKELSLTELDHNDDSDATLKEIDVAVVDEDAVATEQKQAIAKAWKKLTPTEQFVLENMIVDEQDANDVLAALQSVGISIKAGVAAAETNRQQLYHFRRKTLKKLAKLTGLGE